MANRKKVIMKDGEPHCKCNLLGRIIRTGRCYDIQWVRRTKTITEEYLKEFLMMEDANFEMMAKANQLCPTCPLNQLPCPEGT